MAYSVTIKTMWLYYYFLCVLIIGASTRRLVERQTQFGTVRGFVDTVYGGHKIEKYLGIPYAKPPVGELRFEPPVPPDPWLRVKDTLQLSPACPQPMMGVSYIQMYVPGFNRTSEDCLYLNIFAPKATRHHQRHANSEHHGRKHAVLVFFHGGSYQNGMGAMVDGSLLAAQDLVVITFNYRLGPLGFLETSDDVFPGNYGLLDQLAALKWIQANIHHFGGDPKKVTIDGHSAGGCSVGLLMLMPMAKGLFTRVIQQSGSPFADWAVTRQPGAPNFYFKLFTAAVGCYGNGTAEVKACLKTIPQEIIHRVILEQPDNPMSLVPRFRPIVDGYVLPDTPERLAANGEINGLEILTGTTTDEGLVAVPLLNRYGMAHHGLQRLLAVMSGLSFDLPDIKSLIDRILEQYYRWPYDINDQEIKKGFIEIVGDYFIAAPTQQTADLLVNRNVTVFFYNYDHGSVYNSWEGVIHGAELFYISGDPYYTDSGNFRYDETDQAMAAVLIQLWANFAKNGLPSLVPLQNFHMPPYTKAKPIYTLMTSQDGQVSMSTQMEFKPDKMAFWNQRVPNLYLDQLRNDFHLLKNGFRPPEENKAPTFGSKDRRENTVRKPPSYVNTHPPGNWILIAACIGLSVLTVLLSVCYCQVRRRLNRLMRQNSVSSGQAIL